MGKLCAKGKAAAKRKYDVYPSAYANMYASAVCSGKVKSKANGGAIASNKLSQKRKKLPKILGEKEQRLWNGQFHPHQTFIRLMSFQNLKIMRVQKNLAVRFLLEYIN